MSSLADVLADLGSGDVEGNISRIKGAVKEQVEASDSRVTVEMTDHFNHSFVPDLILGWPDQKRTRHIFLRTAFRENDLMRDVETLRDEQPILMPLGGIERRDSELANTLQTTAQGSNTLIANPASLAIFDDESEARPVVSLLSHAFLQGGRGLVTPEDAHSSSAALDEGFTAAQEGDPERTSVAIESAGELLDSARASQINRLLHAVWVGSGGAGSNFPGAAGITATLDADSLRFVLELAEIADDDFWRRLGSGLTLGRLAELVDFSASPNLQRLLKGNAYRLEGKACRVIRTGSRLAAPTWAVVNRNLVLSVDSDRLFFAPAKLDELPPPGGEKVAVTLDQLQERCSANGVRLREVKIADGERAVTYEGEGSVDVAEGEGLSAVQGIMPRAELTSASAITGTHDMAVNFISRTAAGYGPAKFSLSALTAVVVPLLVAPSDEEQAVVRSMLSQPESSQASDD